MDLEGTMLSEISQTEKDKYCMLSFTCGIKKLKQISDYNKKERDSQIQRTNQWLPVGTGEGQDRGWEIKSYKLLGIK